MMSRRGKEKVPLRIWGLVLGVGLVGFGAWEGWPLFVLQAGSAVFFLRALFFPSARRDAEGYYRQWRALLLFSLLWIGFVLFQIVPLPGAVLRGLSPVRFEWWRAGQAYGSSPATLSLDPQITRQELMKIVAYLMAGYALLFGRYPVRLSQALPRLLVGLALLESLYGLIMVGSGYDLVLWQEKVGHQGRVTGTFLSKNHFAGLLAICVPLACQVWLSCLYGSRHPSRTWRERYQAVMSTREGSALFIRWSIILLVLLVALAGSHSRMGLLATIAGMSLFLLFRFNHHRAGWTGTGVFVLMMVGVLWWGGGEQLRETFRELGHAAATPVSLRTVLWQDTLLLIQDFPWWGCGWGCFREIFWCYKTHYSPFNYVYPHQDYLSLLTDGGILGTLLVLTGAVAWVRMIRRGMREASGSQRHFLAAALGSFGAFAVHALADFDAQMPAIVMVMVTIMAGAAQTVRQKLVRKVRSRMLV